MESSLGNQVRWLKIYSALVTLLCALLVLSAFAKPVERPRFDEIDVERINIVEADGALRMVISNQERQHPGIVNGKVIERDGPRRPGMIFFNHLGDEMGGLLFGDNGGDGHFGSLTWDKVRGDQTIGFRYLESDNGAAMTGLQMWQQPDLPGDVVAAKVEVARKLPDPAEREAAIQAMADAGELTTNRLFLGKYRDDSVVLLMSDIQGKPRIRMEVTAEGGSKLEFLDEEGEVTHRVPESSDAPVKESAS